MGVVAIKTLLPIAGMHCPYCGAPFETEGTPAGHSGIVRCACAAHPVLEGVLCLTDNRARCTTAWPWTRALELLRAGDHRRALASALAPSLRTAPGRAVVFSQRSGIRIPARLAEQAERDALRLIIDKPEATFSEAIRLLRHKSYADYLVQRFANPSIIAAKALLGILPELESRMARPLRVIDIGGGCGHATFLISQIVPSASLVLADQDFANVYMARRFLAPGAACVCLDAEAPLPFADGSFDCVFSLDSFHYVRGKAPLAAEMRRIQAPGGVRLFGHLHNALAFNPAAGTPLSPREYQRILGEDAVLRREDRVLEEYLGAHRLDLSTSDADVDDAPALLAAAGPEWVRRGHDLSRLDEAPSRLHLNPVYAVNRINGSAKLLRTYPTPQLEQECASIAPYMPREEEMDAELASRLGEGLYGNDEVLRGLQRKLIAIPLPERYGA